MTKEIIAQIRKIKKFHSDITDLDSGIHKGSWTKDDVNASELKGMSEMLDAVEHYNKAFTDKLVELWQDGDLGLGAYQRVRDKFADCVEEKLAKMREEIGK